MSKWRDRRPTGFVGGHVGRQQLAQLLIVGAGLRCKACTMRSALGRSRSMAASSAGASAGVGVDRRRRGSSVTMADQRQPFARHAQQHQLFHARRRARGAAGAHRSRAASRPSVSAVGQFRPRRHLVSHRRRRPPPRRPRPCRRHPSGGAGCSATAHRRSGPRNVQGGVSAVGLVGRQERRHARPRPGAPRVALVGNACRRRSRMIRRAQSAHPAGSARPGRARARPFHPMARCWCATPWPAASGEHRVRPAWRAAARAAGGGGRAGQAAVHVPGRMAWGRA